MAGVLAGTLAFFIFFATWTAVCNRKEDDKEISAKEAWINLGARFVGGITGLFVVWLFIEYIL